MAVTFHFQHRVKLPLRTKLKMLIKDVFQQEGKQLAALEIIFCSDDYLLEINKTYLSHNYFTDIITFDYSEGNIKSGEVYISVESAFVNAKTYKVLLFNELTRLIVHGCLHLCGYLDKSKTEKTLMTQKEEYYLLRFETL